MDDMSNQVQRGTVVYGAERGVVYIEMIHPWLRRSDERGTLLLC